MNERENEREREISNGGRSLPKRQPEKRFFYVLSLSFPFAKKRSAREREREEEELLCFRVGRSLHDESGAQPINAIVVVIINNRLLTAFFQESSQKKGKSTKN